jgi:hypothetical protein
MPLLYSDISFDQHETFMKNPLIALCCLGLLQGCNLESNTNSPTQPISFNYDFETGNQGWTAGFSDYPSDYDDLSIYELASGIKSLPDDQSKHAFYIAGHNRSDDLFMYLKTKVSGLQASTRYIANIKIDMLSREGDDCSGIGGSPGGSVYVKFGVADIEPKQDAYYLNVDKGNQLAGGTNAHTLGNVAIPGKSCESNEFEAKVIPSTTENQLAFTSNADGSIWLFVGSDSGYEGFTELYYNNLTFTMTLAP